MDHARHPRHGGLLDPADARGRGVNPLCGDTVEVTLRFAAGGAVAAAGFAGAGCSVSQAAASMLLERAVGRRPEEISALTPDDLLALLGLELNRNRRRCALVALDALRGALSLPPSGPAAPITKRLTPTRAVEP